MAEREIKDIRLKPNAEAEEANFSRIVQAGRNFLERGYALRVTVVLRGRESTNPAKGEELLRKFAEELGPAAVIETAPHVEARTVVMVV